MHLSTVADKRAVGRTSLSLLCYHMSEGSPSSTAYTPICFFSFLCEIAFSVFSFHFLSSWTCFQAGDELQWQPLCCTQNS